MNLSISPRRPVSLGITLIAAGLSACAGIPQDRGFSQVQSQLQARGYADVAQPGIESADKLADEILAKGPLSADDAVRVALLRNPTLRITYARLGFSAADVYDAGRLSNPVLSGSVLFTGGSDVNRYDYGLSQNFLGLLLLPARSRLAKAEFERTQQEAGAAVIDLSGEVQVSYQRLVGAIQIQRMREAVADAADASAQLAQRFYDAGNIPELELELNHSEAGQARADVVAARNDALASRAELGRLLGLPADRGDWQVPERLPAPPAQETSLPQLHVLAKEGRLDLLAKRHEVALQEDALGLTRSSRLLGDVDLGVQGERDTDGAHLLGPSISLQLPLFNQGQGAVLRAQARLELSRAELSRMEVETSQAIQVAQARVTASRELAKRYTDEYIPLRERIVRHTQQRANFMLSGPFELIRARQQEYDTYQKYIETVRDYWVARAELERAVGMRLPGDAPAGTSSTIPPTQPASTAGGQP
ncbi:MAG: TolC family protein [Nevskia sp.]|nr:TolC family protein [Nevskia sp.]